MKEVHFSALKEIEEKFGSLIEVKEEGSSFQIGWEVTLGDEIASFNFTTDGIRIFKLKKLNEKSKYKGLELLRHCGKKAGLDHLLFYGVDEGHSTGAQILDLVGEMTDGLSDIDQYYKTHATGADELGGSLRRIGSRRR